MDCSTSGFPVLRHLLELAQTPVPQVGDAIQPSYPLSSPSLPASVFPSIRVFSNELALRIRRPKFWSFSFSMSPSSEYSGLISFRIDWFDLAAQGTLKTLQQCYETDAEMHALTSMCQKQASNPGLWNSEPPIQQITGCLQGPQSPH